MDALGTIRALVYERAAIYQRWHDPLWAIDGPRRLLELDALLEAAWHERRRLCARCRVGLTEAEAEAQIASSDVEDRMSEIALLEIVSGQRPHGNVIKTVAAPAKTKRWLVRFPLLLETRREEFIEAWTTTRLSLLALAERFGVGKHSIERAIEALRTDGVDRPTALRYHDGKTKRKEVRA